MLLQSGRQHQDSLTQLLAPIPEMLTLNEVVDNQILKTTGAIARASNLDQMQTPETIQKNKSRWMKQSVQGSSRLGLHAKMTSHPDRMMQIHHTANIPNTKPTESITLTANC